MRPLLLLPLRGLTPLAVFLALATAPVASAQAQEAAIVPLLLPGSESDRAERLKVLLGQRSPDGMLTRTVAGRISALSTGRDTVVMLHPEIAFSSNSAHPWGGNDGALRAGRGNNISASAGFALRLGRVTAVIVPQWIHEDNLDFQTFAYPQPSPPERDIWANPFYKPGNSLDYPQRFGDASRTRADLQGRVAVDITPALRVGAGAESRWWGPGMQNALLLSSNAPGVEQIFLESPAPIATRFGRFEYQYLLGQLRESDFFDFDRGNNRRSLSAAVVTWEPPASLDGLPTIGVMRAVMGRGAPSLNSALDLFRDVGRPWSRPADTANHREQISGLFARWLIPSSAVEVWAEWVRYEQVASLRELLEQPGHSQGYTLGMQWARPYRGGTLHLATEFSYVEPSPSIRVRPVNTSYTSEAVPQGWTHHGQMLGPWIGPAASSQWAAADFHRALWRWGITLGRLRRDANYRHLEPVPFKREDLQLYASFRVGRVIGPFEALLEFTDGVRLNHLYQAYNLGGSSGNETDGVDLLNRSLTLTLTPRLFR